MNGAEKDLVHRLTEMIEQVLEGKPAAPSNRASLLTEPEDEALKALVLRVDELQGKYKEAHAFVLRLASGKLADEAPRGNNFISALKQFQSELRYLTWQITEIADGDYEQQVTFSGDFSDAMNKMIVALRERKQIEEKLAASNKTKDKLFSIIAHDLRNPFNSLSGFIRLLQQELEGETPSLEVIKAYVDILNDSIEKAIRLQTNLLEWARLQQNRIAIHPMETNLNEVIDYAIHIGSATAIDKHIALNFLTPGDYPIVTDSAIVNVVLRNLLGNAVKFTPEGGHIDLSVSREETHYVISVKDSGVGIRPEDIGKLFRSDITHSTQGTNQEEGTGLGLMLCKEFVNKLGGTIWVESVYGEGSNFCFTLKDLPLE
jgi:signal transduction histidine kinase